MNEILMLDLGGLGGFRTPLGSPPDTARFSFQDQAQGPRHPDTEPLQPTWRVAEVRPCPVKMLLFKILQMLKFRVFC